MIEIRREKEVDLESRTCVACSLLCQLPSHLDQCDKRSRLRRQWLPLPEYPPTLDGQALEEADAIALASDWLKTSRMTLVTGAWGDVASTRATLAMAKAHQAIIDPWDSDGPFAWIAALQQGGCFQTTLNQLRVQQRPCLVLGDDRLLDIYPLLVERLSAADQAGEPIVWLLGEWSLASVERWTRNGWRVHRYASRIPELIDGLMALLHAFPAEQTRFPKSFDVVWSNRCLPGVTDLGTWNQRMFRWLADWNDRINNTQAPCTALPLGHAMATFQQAATWLSGFPGRMRYRQCIATDDTEPEDGTWDYDPVRYRARSLWEEKETELIIWVDEMMEETELPVSDKPRIVIAPRPPGQAKGGGGRLLYLPCSIPGVDRWATVARADQAGLFPAFSPITGRAVSGKSVSEWADLFTPILVSEGK